MKLKMKSNEGPINKWELVVLLWLCFFFNQADRQIFNVVLPDIQNELGLSYAEMGLIASILTLVYGLLVPIAGFLGDLKSKKNIIIISLLVWSSATLLTGISTTLFELILLRSVATGGGEAFYAPPANALISEYHKKTRATALSIHQTALYVGIIASGYLAGYIADLYGWRHAFYIFGAFGIILAIIIHFRMRKISSNYNNTKHAVQRKSIKETLLVFFKTPTALLLTLGFSGMQFVGIGFLTWMPTFLHEKFDFSLSRAGFDSTFYHHIAAFAGVLIGARIADMYCRRFTRIRIFIQMVGLFLGAPFIYFLGESNSLLVVYISLSMFGLFRGMYDSNIFASLYDVIEAPFRSTATGIVLMTGFCIASLSPYILGVLQPTFGLSNGIAFLSLIYIFSGITLLIAIKFFYKKDLVHASNEIEVHAVN